MNKIAIFGGTKEGRLLCEYCDNNNIAATVFVATEYGETLLKSLKNVNIIEGRKSFEEMKSLFIKYGMDIVYDATHPYAVEVTKQIKRACEETNISYRRVIRKETDIMDYREFVIMKNITSAVDYLKNTAGNILVTTGSKDISLYKTLDKTRLFVRVLPTKQAIIACEDVEIEASHIIGMQGPFSKDLNIALLKQYNCSYMITKESGKIGGFDEKIEACKAAGTIAVIIGRPETEKGIQLFEAQQELIKLSDNSKSNMEILKSSAEYDTIQDMNISICGIGPGDINCMTLEVQQAILGADALMGGARMLEAASKLRKSSGLTIDIPVVSSYKAQEIISFVINHKECKKIVVLMSGDSGFYSGSKQLIRKINELKNDKFYQDKLKIKIMPGISSMSYMSACTGIAWDDMVKISLHGIENNIVNTVNHNKKTFIIISNAEQVKQMACDFCAKEMKQVYMYVGEQLSYKDEKILSGRVEEFMDYTSTNNLISVIIINENAVEDYLCVGIRDEDFIRAEVPMTKSEIRAVIMSKLELSKDAVCYDIGAGTGSVTVEMALNAPSGHIYAIEKNKEACRLIKENIEKFRLDNVTIVEGLAPSALEGLPIPGYVFAGGTSGKLEEILDRIYVLNPDAVTVMDAVSYETIAELTKLTKQFEKRGYYTEFIQISVSRARKAGNYRLMTALNPVTIVVIKRKCEADKID